MPAQLDPFVETLLRVGDGELELTPGRPVTLRRQGASQAVSKQALSARQVEALLREITPAGGAAEFDYAVGRGTVRVRVRRGPQGPAATIDTRREGGGMAAPAAAPGPSASAVGAEATLSRLGEMLRALVDMGGSDLHLRVGVPPIFRAHGVLERRSDPPLVADELEALLESIMPERNRQQWRETGDTDFAYENESARFRVNAARDRRGPVGVIRVIPRHIQTVDELGLSEPVRRLCHLSKGLVLVTGATGSGKSTTLAALIDLVNRTRTDHIITIEDPIEFVHENQRCLVTQREVSTHTESFKRALRAALREDPDIVLVGELRDLETIEIAIETAETGHLVFGTLHTTTAASTVDRVIDQFPPDRQAQIRVMLSESLRAVIAQTLCKCIGGGRVAAREILLVTPAVSNLIREGKTFQIPSVIQTSRKLGMATLNDALLELVEAKAVTPQEAYLKAADKQTILSGLSARGHRFDPAAAWVIP